MQNTHVYVTYILYVVILTEMIFFSKLNKTKYFLFPKSNQVFSSFVKELTLT